MPNPARISSIDLLRGFVMIIMALDHTRDMFHVQALTDDPLNLQTTTPLLFMTRWITHYCAPVFVFLSGTSAFLQTLRKSKKELAGFLISRGIWLIIAEVLIITLGITFDIYYSAFILQVIWAIGISMVILGLCIRLPFAMILTIGVIITAGHNLLDNYEAIHQGAFPGWYYFLHKQMIFEIPNGPSIELFYPFLPWTGIMFLGYCFGKIYTYENPFRNSVIIRMGVALITLFLILRWPNLYGDPKHWSDQPSLLFSLFSFIDTTKYPPSLLYFCMTIGPAMLFLGFCGEANNRLSRIIITYGKVPFFYYALHFYILHTFAAAVFLLNGHSLREGIKGIPGIPLHFLVPGQGYGLGGVYLVWIGTVILLYPLCKWFGNYKRKHAYFWLSYV